MEEKCPWCGKTEQVVSRDLPVCFTCAGLTDVRARDEIDWDRLKRAQARRKAVHESLQKLRSKLRSA